MLANILWQLSYFSVYLIFVLMLNVKLCFAQSPNTFLNNDTLANQLVQKALTNNGEIAAFRLEIERARARLKQARLRPNPSVEFEQGFSNSTNEGSTSVGFSLPIELGAKRQKRIGIAELELEIAQASVADRERKIINEVLTAYAEALATQRELDTMQELNKLDSQTTQIIEVRVKEGDAAPLDLNLLTVEVERLKSRRSLAEGKLQAAIIHLKGLAGMTLDEPLQLQAELLSQPLLQKNYQLSELIELALSTRPDLQLAKLLEKTSKAQLQLVKAQTVPDLVASTKYSRQRSSFDNTPVGVIKDKDNLFTFGISINLPLFNRNQGSQEDAAIAITQAQKKREFLEQVIRYEVTASYTRYQSTQIAVANFQQGVIAPSTANLRIFREVYNLGELRITDLITEQRRLIESEREYTELLLERYKAFSDLNITIGLTSLGNITN